MNTIVRKTLLYMSEVEYAGYSLNHVEGCSHGCRYPCYAYLMKKRCGIVKTYDEWCHPKIVANAMDLLHMEIARLRKVIHNVHMCFATDPFMHKQDRIHDLSLEIIRTLNENHIRCNILTKGIYPEELSNFTRYDKNNEYGITLVSLDETFRQAFEPNTPLLKQRIEALKHLRDNECRTWVSIEPYPTPNLIQQDLLQILKAISFVDKIIFGRLNYSSQSRRFRHGNEFYRSSAKLVTAFCRKHRIECYIKKGTLRERE